MKLELVSPKFDGVKDIKRVKALVKNGDSYVAKDLNLNNVKSDKSIGVLFSWSTRGLRFYDGVLAFDENKNPCKIVHCIRSISEDWAISEEEFGGLK